MTFYYEDIATKGISASSWFTQIEEARILAEQTTLEDLPKVVEHMTAADAKLRLLFLRLLVVYNPKRTELMLQPAYTKMFTDKEIQRLV